jgi:hypothetical protein
MHANVTHTEIDMALWDEAVAGIESVKQGLMTMPGFKDAYWMAPLDGHGLMVSLWEDEGAARAAAPPAGFSPAPGVTVERVETREIVGQACPTPRGQDADSSAGFLGGALAEDGEI